MSESKEIVEKPAETTKVVSIIYRLPFIKQIAEWAAKHVGLSSPQELPAWAWAQLKEIKALISAAIKEPSAGNIKNALVKTLTTIYNPFRNVAVVLGAAGLIIRLPGATRLEKPVKHGVGLIKRVISILPTIIGLARKYRGVLDVAKKVVK